MARGFGVMPEAPLLSQGLWAPHLSSVFNAIGDAHNTIDAVEGNLTIDQLLALQAPTNDLNAAVKTAIDNTIAQKDALVTACLGPTVYNSLLNQQTVSEQLVDSKIAPPLPLLPRPMLPPPLPRLLRLAMPRLPPLAMPRQPQLAKPPRRLLARRPQFTPPTIQSTQLMELHTLTHRRSTPAHTQSLLQNSKPVPTTYYGWSTVTVTIYPTEHPTPTYPASSTEYVTYYETYAPITTTVVVDNKPVPTTIAVYTTVTITVAPVKTACPSPAVYTHPAAPAAPAAPAETKPADAIQQIGDGQIQNPAKPGEASPIQQINDGQIQNPASPGAASLAKPAAYPAKPTNERHRLREADLPSYARNLHRRRQQGLDRQLRRFLRRCRRYRCLLDGLHLDSWEV
ncbi:unnamed protein product [Zymoseptoria tritici ST99CH_1A5]|uniref:Uncharacterized protein n=1 Tax=Zymoseptoria tritici ST99CH_1A5 TaxID=1276529 RepID=A0A1Y6LY34_ZYMTR|nr:unnamed protein product [Zymoseptoria tritici ST99CH_1A5]